MDDAGRLIRKSLQQFARGAANHPGTVFPAEDNFVTIGGGASSPSRLAPEAVERSCRGQTRAADDWRALSGDAPGAYGAAPYQSTAGLCRRTQGTAILADNSASGDWLSYG